MAEPSIKGSIFRGAIDDLTRLRELGVVSPRQIEAALGVEDMAYLESEVNAASWYPMRIYARIVELLGKVEGNGKDTYYVQRGRASARRLIESGLYQQLAFLPRWGEQIAGETGDDSALVADYARKLRLVISLTSSIYNVGNWSVETDPENPRRVRIAVREASDYPESLRLASEGFFNECAQVAREDLTHLYTSERPAPDLILLRMTRDIPDLLGTE